MISESDEIPSFEESMDGITQILDLHNFRGSSEGMKLISLLIALPQSALLISESHRRIELGRKNISIILDKSSEMIGALSDKIPDKDFRALTEALGALNLRFTSLRENRTQGTLQQNSQECLR